MSYEGTLLQLCINFALLTGHIMNARQDYLESIPCSSLLSGDRPDLNMYCIGADPLRSNHR